MARVRLSWWTPHGNINLHDSSRWERLWNSTLSRKEVCFLWQILYHANATKMWRFPLLHGSDPELHCKLCSQLLPEDNEHLFWSFPFASRLWTWPAFSILQLRANSLWCPSLRHTLLGDKLPPSFFRLQLWWDIFRGTLIWADLAP